MAGSSGRSDPTQEEWYLVRQDVLEQPNYLLSNHKEKLTFGRAARNDKQFPGNAALISRNHLEFMRLGNMSDWRSIRWALFDLGGTNGSYVNGRKIPQKTVYTLNHNDFIGIGCPDTRTQSDLRLDQKFVYQIKKPICFQREEDNPVRQEALSPILGPDESTPSNSDDEAPNIALKEDQQLVVDKSAEHSVANNRNGVVQEEARREVNCHNDEIKKELITFIDIASKSSNSDSTHAEDDESQLLVPTKRAGKRKIASSNSSSDGGKQGENVDRRKGSSSKKKVRKGETRKKRAMKSRHLFLHDSSSDESGSSDSMEHDQGSGFKSKRKQESRTSSRKSNRPRKKQKNDAATASAASKVKEPTTKEDHDDLIDSEDGEEVIAGFLSTGGPSSSSASVPVKQELLEDIPVVRPLSSYAWDSDEVIVLEDSEDEERFLSQSQSFLEPTGGNNTESDSEFYANSPAVATDNEWQAKMQEEKPEDEDEIQILNDSQTPLMMRVLERIKSEPMNEPLPKAWDQLEDSGSNMSDNEAAADGAQRQPFTSVQEKLDFDEFEDSPSLFEEENQSHENLITEILTKFGEFTTRAIVEDAIEEDKQSNGTLLSTDNILRIVRERALALIVSKLLQKSKAIQYGWNRCRIVEWLNGESNSKSKSSFRLPKNIEDTDLDSLVETLNSLVEEKSTADATGLSSEEESIKDGQSKDAVADKPSASTAEASEVDGGSRLTANRTSLRSATLLDEDSDVDDLLKGSDEDESEMDMPLGQGQMADNDDQDIQVPTSESEVSDAKSEDGATTGKVARRRTTDGDEDEPPSESALGSPAPIRSSSVTVQAQDKMSLEERNGQNGKCGGTSKIVEELAGAPTTYSHPAIIEPLPLANRRSLAQQQRRAGESSDVRNGFGAAEAPAAFPKIRKRNQSGPRDSAGALRAKPNSVPNSAMVAEQRKKKLQEVAERNKKPQVEKTKRLPPPKETKVPERSRKLLESYQQVENKRPALRREQSPGAAIKAPTSPCPRPASALSTRRPSSSSRKNDEENDIGRQRYSSGEGFLEEEARKDLATRTKKNVRADLRQEKKEKFKKTENGFQAKKLSINNIDFSNIPSQDISRMEKAAKPFIIPGFEPRSNILSDRTNKAKKHVRFPENERDLVKIREIPPRENKVSKFTDHGGVEADVVRPSYKYDKEDVIAKILEWKTSWLKGQLQPDEANHMGGLSLVHLPSNFSNFSEYTKIFLPLMFHDLLASIAKDVEAKEKSGREESIPVLLNVLANKEDNARTVKFQCQAIITDEERRQDLGRDGTIVIINMTYQKTVERNDDGRKESTKEVRPIFGYVEAITTKPYDQKAGNADTNDGRLWELERAASSRRRVLLRHQASYIIKTKRVLTSNQTLRPEAGKTVTYELATNKVVSVRCLTRIKHQLKKFGSLLSLGETNLGSGIINPTRDLLTFSTPHGLLHPDLKGIEQLEKLNSVQRMVVSSSARACLENPLKPKICLIQGPPGTGKSSTIVGIIFQLLAARGGMREHAFTSNNQVPPRILVVASSNAAVDEIALKLMKIKDNLPSEKTIRFFRLGVRQSMHPDVIKYSYDEGIKRTKNNDIRKEKASDALEAEIKTKQKEANQLFENKQAAEAEGNADLANMLDRKGKALLKEIDQIKKSLAKPLSHQKMESIHNAAVLSFLSGVDVILSTLSSCLNHDMEKYFIAQNGIVRGRRPSISGGPGGQNAPPSSICRPISVCILDEASQCVEPEALIPFKYKFQKLIMVGDANQLPATVLSQHARQYNYQQSLFKRLMCHHEGSFKAANQGGKGCQVSLDTQYRMHPEICEWPGKYFYGGLLRTADLDFTSPLAPYTIINMKSSTRFEENGAVFNQEEINFTVMAVETITKILKENLRHLDIGVISFYARQKDYISLELQNRKISGVDVNTVDAYQGSERDVIIISCVRSGTSGIGFLSDEERLNVALTRAKYALVIIGNLQTLQGRSEMWSDLIINGRARGHVHDSEETNFNLEHVLRKR